MQLGWQWVFMFFGRAQQNDNETLHNAIMTIPEVSCHRKVKELSNREQHVSLLNVFEENL